MTPWLLLIALYVRGLAIMHTLLNCSPDRGKPHALFMLLWPAWAMVILFWLVVDFYQVRRPLDPRNFDEREL